ncbi:MAG: hypothetical protein ACRDFQ_06020 [Anaerolineales bacterium]
MGPPSLLSRFTPTVLLRRSQTLLYNGAKVHGAQPWTKKVKAYVVSELAKHHDRNDIIMTLCQKLGVGWNDAELLVQEVELYHGKTVAQKQSPFLMILGGGILVGGLALTYFGVDYFYAVSKVPELLVDVRSAYVMGGSLLTGLGMIGGSILGMWKNVAAFLNS